MDIKTNKASINTFLRRLDRVSDSTNPFNNIERGPNDLDAFINTLNSLPEGFLTYGQRQNVDRQINLYKESSSLLSNEEFENRRSFYKNTVNQILAVLEALEEEE